MIEQDTEKRAYQINLGRAKMKNRAVEQVEELLKGVTSETEITQIEKMIAETKGKLSLDGVQGFWADKRACWEMCQCPEAIKKECPAPKNQPVPCWEIEGTYCKLDDYGATGNDTTICEVCRVYKRWGEGKPINITLCGKGINTSLAELEKAANR
jgi:hypothetical protein